MYTDESWYSPVVEQIGHLMTTKGTIRASAIICMDNDMCEEETGTIYTQHHLYNV